MIFLIFTVIILSLWGCCDEQYYLTNPLTNLCYYYNPNIAASWPDAESYCENLGLTLIMLNTPEKLNFTRNLSIQSSKDIYVNINLYDSFTTIILEIINIDFAIFKVGTSATIPFEFTWLDGSPINSTYWYNGEPNNGGGNDHINMIEGCATLTYFYLNDVSCNTITWFICQLV